MYIYISFSNDWELPSFLIDLSSIIFNRLSLQPNFAQPGWTEIATCLSQSLPELLSQAAGNQDILPLPAVNFYFVPGTFDYTGMESYLTSPLFYRSECVAAWFCERNRKFEASHCAGGRWQDYVISRLIWKKSVISWTHACMDLTWLFHSNVITVLTKIMMMMIMMMIMAMMVRMRMMMMITERLWCTTAPVGGIVSCQANLETDEICRAEQQRPKWLKKETNRQKRNVNCWWKFLPGSTILKYLK